MLSRQIPQSIDDIIILEEKNNKLVIQLNDVTIPYMKILRESMYERVPTMAIDKVKVYNLSDTTGLSYELVSDRLSLMPIKANPDDFDYFDGEFNQDSTLIFTLDKTGPNQRELLINRNSDMVLSKDIKWIPFEDHEYEEIDQILNIKFDPDANQKERFINDPPMISSEYFVLMKLRTGENVNLTGYAIKGTGKTNTKFSPVSRVFYDKLNSDDIIIEGTSLDPISLRTPGPTEVQDEALMAYLENRMYNKSITVTEVSMAYKPEDFAMTLISKGQIPPRQILDMAIKDSVNYMELPLSKREIDIHIPGYIY